MKPIEISKIIALMSDEICMILNKWMDECTSHDPSYYKGRQDALVEFRVKLENLLYKGRQDALVEFRVKLENLLKEFQNGI